MERLGRSYARRITMNGKTSHYVRQGSNGMLFNPIGIFSNPAGTANKISKHSGKQTWVFRKVPERVFRFYINFLKTKNSGYLRNAERELL